MSEPAYGADLRRYQFIPRVLLIITHRSAEDAVPRVLLLRRSLSAKLWPGKYNAPGGHIERGEDPYEAALRELEEETGVRPGPLRLAGFILNETGLAEAGILVFVFHGEAASALLTPKEGEGAPIWAARADLAALDLVSDLPDVLSLVLGEGLAASEELDFFYLYKALTPEGEMVRQRLISARHPGAVATSRLF